MIMKAAKFALISFLLITILSFAKAQITFVESSQQFDDKRTYEISVGDVDNDGDIDILDENNLWLNNGDATFNKKVIDTLSVKRGKLADLDGDGDLDIFYLGSNYNTGSPNEIWYNDGKGNFANSGQELGNRTSYDAIFKDLDDDGDIDIFVCNHVNSSGVNGGHIVWINQGDSVFIDSGQNLGNGYTTGIDSGDIDNDGDIDILVSFNYGNQTNLFWINKGNAEFTQGQENGSSNYWDLKLGDLDGINGLDIFVASSSSNKVWLNNGDGTFTDNGQKLGNTSTFTVALGDLDKDGDLDAFVGNATYFDNGINTVYINKGNGEFEESGLQLGNDATKDIELADFDGDGDLDAIVANSEQPNKLWLNTTDTTIASINDFEESFKVHPNPAQNTLQIEFPGIGQKEAFYQIIDLSGKTLQQGRLTANTIDVSKVSKGTYILNIDFGKETINKKITIN